MDADTPTRSRDQLSEAKRLLLEKRIRGQARPAEPRNAIRRRGGGPAFPMSYAQERLWFLDQVEPGRSFYNIPGASLVSARIDVPTLERAFGEVIRRHEALRTVFRLVDGEPRQIVQPPADFKIDMSDLRGPNGEPADEATIRRTISRLGGLPFNLAQGPLVRVHLVRVSDADYALLCNVHHIVTDGWSMPILMREMTELYEAYSRGLPSPLPELAVQYADYSAWQREYLSGETLRQQVDYWRRHLEGAPTLELPTDRPRPPVLTYRGNIYRFVWPAALTDRIRRVAVETGSSMNMVIMAGFYLMLHQYSGQDDLVVGTLLGNRNRAETEPLIGFFVNTAPIRARLAERMTFRELIRQVRTSVLDADAHQDLPFDKIVDELKVERDPARNALFQVMYFHHTFVKEHHKEDSEFASELNIRALFQETGVTLVDTDAAKFDLTFATLEMGGALANMCEYSSDLWDEETMARMMEHTRVLLDRGCERPDALLSDLSHVADAERERLLAWGTNDRGMEMRSTLVARLDARAAETPDAPAVEYADARLTYAGLRARADAVTRRLLGLGVRPGDRVGVATDASAAMVAAIAGILRAGAAVVPLDPEYPAERLAFMVGDSGARFVLVPADRAETDFGGARTLVIGAADESAEAAEAADAVPPEVGPDDVAYVIYTSGSTGTPKAVLTTHGALVRTFVQADFVEIRPGDRVMQGAGLSFDAAVFETWAPLVNGATVVGMERDVMLSPPDLARELGARRIEIAFLTTQLFNRHVHEVPGVFAALRTVLIGGEAADPSAVRACLQAGAPGRLVNGYGPTEAAVFATWHPVDALAPDAVTVPIGRPLQATRLYVLDERGRLCGTGVPGELCIGGGRVAAGYLDRPELTAERFVADPFAGGDARMYRTGDRVRWTSAGVLEFMGRADEQVKVRGFRIEPGEVEAALREHPAVRGCVVVAREDGGERRLVAYVVGDGVDEVDFRAHLKPRLPDYMVPSAFVALDAIPLTPNGKLDRRRLPAPDPTAVQAVDSYAEPRTHAERVMAQLWAEVLRLERVGIYDNFFALGGDSILSIQIIARAAQAGVRVTPKQMFVHQTIAELAAVATETGQPQAEQGPVTGDVPLTPVQHWFFGQNHPDPAWFNLGLLFDAPAGLHADAVQAAADAVLAHHDALRMRYTRTADGWTQHLPAPHAAVVDRIDLSAVPAEERDAAFARAAEGVQRGLDLEHGPLVRLALVDRGDAPQRLLVVAHHLVVDAVSWQFVAADLDAAYRQAAAGQPVALPAKSTSFKAWAERLAEHARSDEARGELAFWTAQAAAGFAPLPEDHAGGSNLQGEAGYVTAVLDEAETRALLTDVPPVYNTQVNDVLLAGLARAFRGWTGADALWVDLEGHGREELFEGVDVSRTAGWFTAIHPLRLAAPADPGDALRTAKEQLRAVPRRGVGFGLLRWMGDDATRSALAALPVPQVAFNYLGQMDGGGAGPAADAVLVPAAADAGSPRSPTAPRTHLLSIDAAVMGGRLRVTWTYAPGAHDRATVERLAEGYLQALRELVAHCRDPQAGGYTPSDFALAGLDQEGLDALLSKLGG